MSALAQSTKQNKIASTTSASSLLVQRKCACGGVSKLAGQCSECEKKKLVGGNGSLIQPKLKIGQSNDKYEQEADRVAVQVMRMPEPKEKNTSQGKTNTDRTKSGLSGGNSAISIQRQEAFERENDRGMQIKLRASNLPQRQKEPDFDGDEDFLQAKATTGYTSQVTPNVATNIRNLRGGGQPLPANQRRFFESRMGQDFSGVRIHTDSKAADAAQAIQAKAFTLGNNIVFNTGQYSHDNQEGKKLLAHELTHVVQQSGSDGISAGRCNENRGAPPNSRMEAAIRVLGRTATVRLQRAPKSSVKASHDLSGVQARLDKIIRTGGPLPTDKTTVVGALIVNVEGYTGPKEIRALSGARTDTLGRDALVFHASTPTDRTLSATSQIKAAPGRGEFNFSHINDAEMKMFEEVNKHLPPDPKGSIHFSTMRHKVKNGIGVLEPVPACSGCNRASFQMGAFRGVNIVSYAATFPTGSLDIAKTAASRIVPLDEATLKAMPREAPKWVRYPKKGSGRQWFRVNVSDADLDPKTGKVVDGPKTSAARLRREQRQQKPSPAKITAPKATSSPPKAARPAGPKVPTASTGRQPESPRAAAQRRSGRPRAPFVTTPEIENDEQRLRETRRAAADIAAEIAPRPGRFARALGKLGKVARYGSKLLPFAPLLETYSAVKTIEAAEEQVNALRDRRDYWNDQAYAALAKMEESQGSTSNAGPVSVPSAPIIREPTPEREARTIRVFALRAGRLTARNIEAPSNEIVRTYVRDKFATLTQLGASVYGATSAPVNCQALVDGRGGWQRVEHAGYVPRSQVRMLHSLLAGQLTLLRVGCVARGYQPTQKKETGERIAIRLFLDYGIAGEEFSASLSRADIAGHWVSGQTEGDFESLKDATESAPADKLPDFLLEVDYQVAGKKSFFSLESKLRPDGTRDSRRLGKLPGTVCHAERYPSSVLEYVLRNYGDDCDS